MFSAVESFMIEHQTTADVLMIRPAGFCANTQTAATNRFQQSTAGRGDLQAAALAEFDALVIALRQANVRVHVFDDTVEPRTPDALFPNNWVSFHADGTLVLYPMLAPNRRLERRMDILESLSKEGVFRTRRVVDLTHREKENEFLEGTGSLVLDRVNRIAYAGLSPRTHLDALGEFAQLLDYRVVAFDAADRNGVPIYHTNVLMSVGRHFAAVCTEAIRDDQRDAVIESLRSTGHQLIDLSYEQIYAFAGNILELRTATGGHVVALSKTAATALNPKQRMQLKDLSGALIEASIPTIETQGGGSVRCMMAEIHRSRAVPA
jgi:hypothetical protein